MIRSDLPPNLVLAAIAWDAAARGGTSGRDLLITGALLAAAALYQSGHDRLRMCRINPTALTIILLAFEAWLVARGPLAYGISLNTLRLPILVVFVAITLHVCTCFTQHQRTILARGLVTLGTAHAAIAIASSAAHFSTIDILKDNVRAAGLLGNANALGVLLVATMCLTASHVSDMPLGFRRAALITQATALLLTGSRLAITIALLIVGWYVFRRRDRRTGLRLLPAAILAGLIVMLRFDHGEPSRPQLWQATLEQIDRHPLTGRGPIPQILSVDSIGLAPTTQAHNEILQLTLEYGVVGLLLAILLLFTVLRNRRVRWGGDRWLVTAAAAITTSGLTDFSLRITAITVTAAALIGLARELPSALPTGAPTENKRSPIAWSAIYNSWHRMSALAIDSAGPADLRALPGRTEWPRRVRWVNRHMHPHMTRSER